MKITLCSHLLIILFTIRILKEVQADFFYHQLALQSMLLLNMAEEVGQIGSQRGYGLERHVYV